MHYSMKKSDLIISASTAIKALLLEALIDCGDQEVDHLYESFNNMMKFIRLTKNFEKIISVQTEIHTLDTIVEMNKILTKENVEE